MERWPRGIGTYDTTVAGGNDGHGGDVGPAGITDLQ